MRHIFRTSSAIALCAGVLAAPAAHAALTVTSSGASDGFSLSLFADQFPTAGCCGPLGIAMNGLGQVVVQDYGQGRNVVFSDVDGQHFSNALSSTPFQSTSYGASLTNSGGTLYATNNDAGGIVYKLNNDGSVNSALTTTGAGGHGIWTNPATGHLLAATSANTINDINPATGAFTQIVSGYNVDGVSVSADGKVIYGAAFGHVYGWNYSGAVVYDSGALGNPDGTGVIQGNNKFSGDVVANDNSGNVWLLDPKKNTTAIIASGGTRGDYVGVDLKNGTLFLTQSDSVYRLSCGKNCGFTAPVPEPSTYALMALGLGFIGWQRRRRASDAS